MSKIEKGKCWFEVYRDGFPIVQDQHHDRTRKWLTWKGVKSWVLKAKMSEKKTSTYDIQPYCPHKTASECCSCTNFDEYWA